MEREDGGGMEGRWSKGGRGSNSHPLLCDHCGCGHSSPFMFMGGYLLLLEVIIVGSHLLLLCISGGQGQLLSFINCVDGSGKEKGSHITHCDNGTMFELPCEITCK